MKEQTVRNATQILTSMTLRKLLLNTTAMRMKSLLVLKAIIGTATKIENGALSVVR